MISSILLNRFHAMKTTVYMERELLGCSVRQDSKTQMLSATDLHTIGCELRTKNGLKTRQLSHFFNLDTTKELIEDLRIIEGLPDDEIKKSKRGTYGGTWVHPILFVDLAMWYSSEIRMRVLKWVVDGLIKMRNDSGDSYKAMCNALYTDYAEQLEKRPILYSKVAAAVAKACGVNNSSWEFASESQLEKRDLLQKNIILLSGTESTIGQCVNKAVMMTEKQIKLLAKQS